MAHGICTALQVDSDDQSKEIRFEDFVASSHHGEMAKYLEDIDVNLDEVKYVFSLIDTDGSGGLSPLELVTGLMRLRGTARAVDVALLFQRSQDMVQDHTQRVESTVSRGWEAIAERLAGM